MKRTTIILMSLLITILCNAQDIEPSLIVYEVTGKVKTTAKKGNSDIVKRQMLSLKDKISIPENGIIKLLDKQQKKMYTLKAKCQGSIQALIAEQKGSEKNLTKQYFAYILKSLTRKDTNEIYNSGLTTVTYRNDADSLLCDIDSLQNVVDSLTDVIRVMKNDTLQKR